MSSLSRFSSGRESRIAEAATGRASETFLPLLSPNVTFENFKIGVRTALYAHLNEPRADVFQTERQCHDDKSGPECWSGSYLLLGALPSRHAECALISSQVISVSNPNYFSATFKRLEVEAFYPISGNPKCASSTSLSSSIHADTLLRCFICTRSWRRVSLREIRSCMGLQLNRNLICPISEMKDLT